MGDAFCIDRSVVTCRSISCGNPLGPAMMKWVVWSVIALVERENARLALWLDRSIDMITATPREMPSIDRNTCMGCCFK